MRETRMMWWACATFFVGQYRTETILACVFKNELVKDKLQMRYRRLHAYRELVLSQTK